MLRWSHIAVLATIVSAQSACTSFDLEEQEELDSQSQQISAQESIVLCPVVAALEPSSNAGVSVVWAGYPPNDDRLQLMRARVSQEGQLLSSQSIAFLDGELLALELRTGSDALELEFVDSEAGELRVLRLKRDGSAQELDASASSWSDWSESAWQSMDSGAACRSSVLVGNRDLSVFRTQADGGLSLFVQSVRR